MSSIRANPQLPPLLFEELYKLNLSDSELLVVLGDIEAGPGTSRPNGLPSDLAQLTLQQEVGMLGLLEDYTFTNSLDTSLFVASEHAFASVFFKEVSDTYEALSLLGFDDEPDGSGESDQHIDKEVLLGGRKLHFNSGTYDLGSGTNPTDYIIAANDKLVLLGNIVFSSASSNDILILLSADSIDVSNLRSLTYTGEELGIGSFEALNFENVSLKAEGALSVRSLDSIVLNNAEMITSGKGADFVHLIAASEIHANSLQFSSQVKEIAMQAMTINLSNLNFPSNSNVILNSLYGGMDGKYPNFGSVQYGRVNFIQNIMYGSQSITDRSSFNQYGNNIKIGTTSF